MCPAKPRMLVSSIFEGKMQILVTNDDGVDAPGLLALKRALDSIGETLVVAPEHNWSAAGHRKTMHKPLRLAQVRLDDGTLAYSASGSPSDCVALVMLGALRIRPDLVVSGINPNPNLGQDMTYSGTVTAAMEGTISGVPSFAVSTDAREAKGCGVAEPFAVAAGFAAVVARKVIAEGLPSGVLLNVNVPGLAKADIAGVQVTRMCRRIYRDELVERADPRGKPYYWIGGEEPTAEPDAGTDFWALTNGFISVTPLHLDLTAYKEMDCVQSWALQF
jgi:5'-nucleotidase